VSAAKKQATKKATAAAPAVGYSQRPRLDKLGIKPGARVALIGLDDPSFLAELKQRTPDIANSRPRKDTDVIVLRVDGPKDLARLTPLQKSIRREGMIWAIWPKGQKHIGEGMIRDAALAQGLVDVKVMAFSETLSGLKLVIPVAKR
jgi:hypothetical protein